MKNIHYLFLLFIILGCSKKIYQADYYKKSTPPNGVRIGENTFIDQTEVPNLDYRFFTDWTKRYFGDTSAVYQHILPDTTVWLGQVENDTFLMKQYFRSGQFDHFPVLGVSQAQAQLFSQWRANIVFQSILLQNKIIQPPYLEEKQEIFTIQKYLRGEYQDYEPDRRIQYYPHFRLPTKSEVIQAEKLLEKHRLEYFLDCKDEHCEYCSLEEYLYASQLNVDYRMETFNSPTRPTRVDCRNIVMFKTHNLKGNVSEWLSVKDSIYGGSWIDDIDPDIMIFEKSPTTQNAFTGFRNGSEWIKIDWEKY